MKMNLLGSLAAGTLFIVQSAGARPVADEVDTSIGSITLSGYGGHGLGKTFPGACVPFGMVQLSPDTITGGDNGPGYSYHHDTIEGFSFTHMSGIGWYGDLGNVQVQPGTGAMRYFHSEETTKAGLYEVMLREKANFRKRVCRVSATALEDCGVLRFRYEADAPKTVTVDLARRVGELWRAKKFSSQRLDFVSDREFTGMVRCDHRDGGWGHGAGGVDYTLYFRGIASAPLSDRVLTGGETNCVLTARFGGEGREVTLAVRLSYRGVPAPFADGVPDFEATRKLARSRWEKALGAVTVEGGSTRQRRTFATALYHTMIDPRRLDGAPLPGGRVLKRTVFSGWDVFRSEMPLLALLRPDDVAETIDAMCETVRSGKRDYLPLWDLFACPGGCMLGNPLIPVMLTAADCGIPFDLREAVRLAADTARRHGNSAKLGYAPKCLSSTLEYAYADWCVARLAARAGDEAVRREFDERALWYRNVWDPSVGWMRARLADGSWMPWKGETVHGQGTTESNPLQQGWFVPHDVDGLVRLVGGRDKFVAKLETFFEKAPDDFLWGDYYNHPNEPSHHIPFLFAKAGRPDLASKWTRRILDKAYSDDVRGLCGNDDVGQMSAWYVLAALGLNPMCPGSGEWILTAPLFPKATVRLPARGSQPAATLVVETRGKGARIVRAELNGRRVDRPWLTTAEILGGGTLVVTLEPETLDIDCGRQLFVDDRLVASATNVVRHYGKPVKRPRPLVVPTDPKKGRLSANVAATDGGLWWDPTIRKYRLWYASRWCGPLCYAESSDGFTWDFPDLGVVPGTNRLFTNEPNDTCAVFPDYAAANPYGAWNLFVSPAGYGRDQLYTAADGRHFKSLGVVGDSADRSTMYYDPFRAKWIFSLRDMRAGVGRSRRYHAQDAFRPQAKTYALPIWDLQGTEERNVVPEKWTELEQDFGSGCSLYSFSAVAYESVMIGVMEILRMYRDAAGRMDNAACEAVGLPKRTDLHFAVSRDGRNFERLGPAPALSPEGWGSGAWDTGYLSPVGGICVIRDEELCFHYTGLRGDALRAGKVDDKTMKIGDSGCYYNAAVGVATLRRDGFAGMVADGRGELLTERVRFSGRELFVNADTTFGNLRAEVCDAAGKPLAGFTFADSTPLAYADTTKTRLVFAGGDLASLAGRDVRFRFALENATLFSFWVSKDASGKSGGYVAAGGPAYPGLKDE